MYCRNCGRVIADTETVCQYCGAYVGGYEQYPASAYGQGVSNYAQPGVRNYGWNAVDQRFEVRQSETDELERMINHFSQKQAQYDEYDQVMRRLDPANRKKRVGLLVWGIIFCFISAVLFLVFYSLSRSLSYGHPGYYSYASAIFKPSYRAGYSSNTAPMWLCGIVFFGGLTMIIMFIITSVVRANNYSRALSRYEALSAELMDHYSAYLASRGHCLVSPEYTNPHNLAEILNVIRSGRADTIRDAVNILVEDAHRFNMRAIARQNSAAAAAAASGAKAAAVFSAANFFISR